MFRPLILPGLLIAIAGCGRTGIDPGTLEPTIAGCARSVTAGGEHTCALTAGGVVWCWGANYALQLGDGTQNDSDVPVEVTALGSNVAQISVGDTHSCALKTDGTLWCWGSVPGTPGSISATAPTQVASFGNRVARVTTGSSHDCAVLTDGTLWCWGDNQYGQLGIGTTNQPTAPVQVLTLGSDVVEASANSATTCARKTDGTLWCWGHWLNQENTVGEAVQIATFGTSAAAQSVGVHQACVLENNSTLWCWGWFNFFGQIGDGTQDARELPVQVADGVAQVSTAYHASCAVKTNGTLWCWGRDLNGPFPSTMGPLSPKQITSLGRNVSDVSVGGFHACARKTDGTLWCWGSNSHGQLGQTPGEGGILFAPPTAVRSWFGCY